MRRPPMHRNQDNSHNSDRRRVKTPHFTGKNEHGSKSGFTGGSGKMDDNGQGISGFAGGSGRMESLNDLQKHQEEHPRGVS